MFALDGPIVHQLVDTFDVDFSRWGPRGAPVERTLPAALPPRTPGTSRGRVLRGWPDARDFPSALLLAVRDAQHDVRIGTPYFVPRLRLLASLARALKRGVRVHLVLPSYQWSHPVVWYAGRRQLGMLLQRGARIHEYAPSFYHAKIAVVDDTHAFVGSSNIDGWSWRSNAELDLVFHDADTVRRLTRCFDADRARSTLLTRDAHRAAGLRHRAYQGIARLLSRWM
jgi:cardiolipin synthase